MRRIFIALAGLLLIAACSAGARAEIVRQSATDSGALLSDTPVLVECEVHNAGDAGNVIVIAGVEAQNGAWSKRQISIVLGGRTRVFLFEFPEVEYQPRGDNSFEFECGLE